MKGSTALIYLRVSTEEQAEQGFSMAAQREECKDRAREMGAQKIVEFKDEGVSGSILERPALLAALENLKKGDISWFICLDTSRLSRSVAHQLLLIDEIKKTGAELVFVQRHFRDTPEDRFQLTVLSAVDEYERARTRLRSLIGKRAKARAGKLTHSPGLYGYSFDKETDTLKVVSEQAEIIRLMYCWLAADEEAGPYEISRRLNAMGIPSPRYKTWSRQTVRRILANSAYAGTLYLRRYDTREVRFNKYKSPAEKIRRVEKPFEEWVPVSVPPLVDRETWNTVQGRLENARRRWRSCSSYYYLCSGLIYCELCGSTVHGNLVSSKGKKYPYYVCTAKSPGISGRARCPSKHLRAEELEEKVWKMIAGRLADPFVIFEELAAAFPAGENRVLKAELAAVQRELKDIASERSRVVTMYQKKLLWQAEMEERLAALKERLEYLSRRQQELLESLERQDLKKGRKLKDEEREAAVEQVQDLLHVLNREEKKHLLHLLLKKIRVDSKQAVVEALLPEHVFFSRHDPSYHRP